MFVSSRRRHTRCALGLEFRRVLFRSTENLSFKNVSGSRKFRERFIGPFKVLSKTSDVNYKLQLPSDWGIHNVFHVSKLRRYIESDDELFPDRQIKPVPDIIQGEEEWKVEIGRASCREGVCQYG